MDWVDLLSSCAVLSTVLMYLCGLQICARVRQRGHTEGTSAAPILITFVSCAFWFQYGVLIDDNAVIWNNVIGLAMYLFYLLYFYYMTRNKRRLNRIIAAELLAILIAVYSAQQKEWHEEVHMYLGIACAVLNVITYGAPLAALRQVIATKSSECLPFPLCVASLLVSAQWLLYGVLIHDVVIQFPNFLAVVISTLQLSLFYIYPSQLPHSPLPTQHSL